MGERIDIGSSIGHYRIVSKIGAGGMGEVYKAHDSRLDREVAIKVLPSEMSSDEDRLRRFEQEAKATSALNHPNILTVYDIGEHDGSPFIVAELLDGEELRQRLDEGQIPLRKVTEYAQQIVSGLSAAHEKGIVHRDLKPENLFITKDDRVKILDFGLAKLSEPPASAGGQSGNEDATRRALTNPGVVMGTVGYMSPEQVRGHKTDSRSDIFSFGLILYEMVTGKRAFQHETMAETMSAILKEEPTEITESNPNISPSLERIVRRCLEKKPDRRFQSTSDLGFAIESLSAPTSSSGTGMTTAVNAIAAESDRETGKKKLLWIAAVVLVLAVIGFGIWFGRGLFTPSAASVADVSYKPISFEKGFIYTARFAADGRTIVYSADWERQPLGVYVTNTDDFKYRPLGFPGADLLGVSRTGELAVLNGSTVLSGNPYHRIGTLARASMTGGAARPELEGVRFADFGANNTVAVIRDDGVKRTLEYPIGQVLAQIDGSVGELHAPRVSPSGEHVAFFECRKNDCRVKVLDRSGKFTTESVVFLDWWAVAWKSPNELWFAAEVPSTGLTGTTASGSVGIYSLDLAGRQRKVFQTPISLTLHDISAQGDVLVTFDRGSPSIETLEGLDPTPKDRSWRGGSLSDFSANGALLINGNNAASIWLANDEQVIQIAEGAGFALSADGSKAIVASLGKSPKVTIVPTGAGQAQIVDGGPIDSILWAGFLPDGRIVIKAIPPNSSPVTYLLSAAGRDPKPLLPDGFTLKDTARNVISPDGANIVAIAASGQLALCTIAKTSCRPLTGIQEGDDVAGWTADGKSIYVFNRKVVPTEIDRLDVATGRRTAWKTLHTLNPSAAGITSVIVTPDGSVAYGYRKDASQLYVIKGLK